MAEYIEREALMEALRKYQYPYGVEFLVSCQPAADVAPVVHGRWIFKWDSEKDPRRLFVRIVCSECNLHTGQKSTYCPNCGAKMQGAEDE